MGGQNPKTMRGRDTEVGRQSDRTRIWGGAIKYADDAGKDLDEKAETTEEKGRREEGR